MWIWKNLKTLVVFFTNYHAKTWITQRVNPNWILVWTSKVVSSGSMAKFWNATICKLESSLTQHTQFLLLCGNHTVCMRRKQDDWWIFQVDEIVCLSLFHLFQINVLDHNSIVGCCNLWCFVLKSWPQKKHMNFIICIIFKIIFDNCFKIWTLGRGLVLFWPFSCYHIRLSFTWYFHQRPETIFTKSLNLYLPLERTPRFTSRYFWWCLNENTRRK